MRHWWPCNLWQGVYTLAVWKVGITETNPTHHIHIFF